MSPARAAGAERTSATVIGLARVAGPLARLPLPVALLLGVVLIVALGFVDYLTGPELAFAVFYLAPIALAALAGGLRLGIPLALAAALTWLAADVAAGQQYRHPAVPVWNAGTRMGMFVVVALLITKLDRALRHEQELSRTDPLTGVANARAFIEAAELEIERAARHGVPLTVVYVDLDDFKRINDEHGHSGGDDELRGVGRYLTDRVRSSDLVARLGGDEFGVLLRDTDEAGAAALLPSLSLGPDTDGRRVGLSVGAVTYHRPPESVDELFRTADTLMYEAKQRGKGVAVHKVVA